MADLQFYVPNVTDVHDRITQPQNLWTAHTDERPRRGERGNPVRKPKPVTEAELEQFIRSGGKIDHCDQRLAQQVDNDKRAAERKDVRPFAKRLPHARDLIDIVIDACASAWDADKYLARHRAIVQEILDQPRNRRHHIRANMSTRERRHQQALRLLHAIAFDGVTKAEYCRQHRLDKADASRMLAHLYGKEPELAGAVSAISACPAGISWQNRQRDEMLRQRDRDDDQDRANDAKVWSADVLADEIALALFNLRAAPIRAPAPYRVERPLSKALRLKDGGRETQPIARAATPGRPAYTTDEVVNWPQADRDFLKRDLAACTRPIGRHSPPSSVLSHSDAHKVERKMHEAKWAPRPMCNPVRSNMWLAGVSKSRQAIWEDFIDRTQPEPKHGSAFRGELSHEHVAHGCVQLNTKTGGLSRDQSRQLQCEDSARDPIRSGTACGRGRTNRRTGCTQTCARWTSTAASSQHRDDYRGLTGGNSDLP